MKLKNWHLIVSVFFLFYFCIFLSGTSATSNGIESDKNDEIKNNLRFSNSQQEMTPIFIDGDAKGFGAHNWTWAINQWWCTGSGTYNDPYLIENLIINGQNSGSCIEIVDSNVYFRIKNCKIYNSSVGVYPNFKAGIKLINTSNGEIVNNNCFLNNRNGIYLTNQCRNNNISRNIVNNNSAYGILIDANSNNNTISENRVNYNNWYGIALDSSYNNKIARNNASYNGYSGILLAQLSHSNVISENILNFNSQYGIRIDTNSYNNSVSRNSANFNVDAGITIAFQNCHNNIVLENIANNNGRGIWLSFQAHNNTIARNILQNNVIHGIYIALSSYDNIVSGNNISKNGIYGIMLDDNCDNNIIKGNIISENSNYGVFVSTECDSNLFYNNQFINIHYGFSAKDNGQFNLWDNDTIGNYWDDYKGTDTNDDGIGDSPYSIDGSAGSQDYYPIWDDSIDFGLPIFIDGEATGVGAHNWTWAANQWWCTGSGTESDPYIIKDLEINANNKSSAILINNSRAYFIIKNCKLINSSFSPNAGIYLENTTNGILENNYFSLNNGHGIYLLFCHHNNITKNIIINSTNVCGLLLLNSYNNTILRNQIIGCNHGLGITGGHNNTILENKIIYSNWYGINLDKTYDNDFLRNEIHFNYEGIYFFASCKQNFFSNNIISNNTVGIYIFYEYNEGNIFTQNFIKDNTRVGMYINYIMEYNNDNLFYDNYFSNPDALFGNVIDSCANYFDNGKVGNYWHDYTGVDANDDGIGDTPYVIDFDSQDNYPIWDDGIDVILPIFIDGSATGLGAHNWTWAANQWWCSGSGTYNDPYLIENLTINAKGFGNCIEIRNSNVFFIIKNCILFNSSEAGIKLDHVNNGQLIDNNCSFNNKYGIFLWYCNKNNLTGNIVSNNLDQGFYLAYGTQNNLNKNIAESNVNSGFSLYHEFKDTLIDNIAINNSVGFSLVVGEFSEKPPPTMDNIFRSNFAFKNDYSGFYLSGVFGNIFIGNNASYNAEHGFYLSDCYNNNFSSNIASRNYYGYYFISSSNNNLNDNNVTNNEYGFYQESSPSNVYIRNIATHNDYGFYFTMSRNNILLRNIASDNKLIGFYFDDSYNTLKENIASNNLHGFYFSSYEMLKLASKYTIITGNMAKNNIGYGFYISGYSYNNITGNIAKNNTNGFYLVPNMQSLNKKYSSYNNLTGNIAINNLQYGYYIYDSPENILDRNVAKNNSYGFYIGDNSYNNLILNNIIAENIYGIFLYNSNNNNISRNNIYVSTYEGIILQDSNNNIIFQNNVSNNEGRGMFICSSNDNLIAENIVNNNGGEGICLHDASNYNTISKNIANNNFYNGIKLEPICEYNKISENIVNSNSHGILLEKSNFNNVSGNVVNNNFYNGIYVGRSHNNFFLNNNATDNGDDGIRFVDCFDNTVSGNRMYNGGLMIIGIFENATSHNIENTNFVNDKPLYCYKNEVGLGPIDFLNAGQIILIKCTDSSISNLEISYSSVGISLYECANIIISNITISNNNHYGVFLFNCNNTKVLENTLSYNGLMGLYIWGGYENNFTSNLLNDNYLIGMYGYECHNSIFSQNTAFDNKYGIYLSVSNENTLFENVVINNSYGVIFNSCENNILSDNIAINNTYGFRIGYESNGNYLGYNIALNNTIIGIWLENSYDNKLLNNKAINNTYGFKLETSSNFNYFSGNIATFNTKVGFWITKSSNNNLTANTVSNNWRGFWLEECMYSNVFGNTIENNKNHGILIESCLSITISHNNFINNGIQAYDTDPINNNWYHPFILEGNYWSDYLGSDIDSDGIGDTNIPWPMSGYDYYPLINLVIYVPTGLNIEVFDPITNITLIFNEVTESGRLTINKIEVGPVPPEGYIMFNSTSGGYIYYDIDTSAKYQGIITICIPYNETQLTNPFDEAFLKLWHWNSTSVSWEDITVGGDAENNIIFGELTGFSIFAVMSAKSVPPGYIGRHEIVIVIDKLYFHNLHEAIWNLPAEWRGFIYGGGKQVSNSKFIYVYRKGLYPNFPNIPSLTYYISGNTYFKLRACEYDLGFFKYFPQYESWWQTYYISFPGTSLNVWHSPNPIRSGDVSFYVRYKIFNYEPMINSIPNQIVIQSQPITFFGSGSDPEGDSLTYEWDFSYDGTSFNVESTEQNPIYSYLSPGDYIVAYRAKDQFGAYSTTKTSYITVYPVEPINSWGEPGKPGKTYGGGGYEEAQWIERTIDGGYIIVGGTTSYGAGDWDFYLVKIDTDGNLMWYKSFGGASYDCGECVKQTIDGGFIIVGYTHSFGNGAEDIWLIKTDKYGNMEWSKTFGGTQHDYGWCVELTREGGYIITGYTNSHGSTYTDVWLIKTDALGNEIWNKTYGGNNHDVGYCIDKTSDGSYIVTGFTVSSGARDLLLFKIDANGNELWSKIYGGINSDWGQYIEQTVDGSYIITGYTESFGNRNDLWLIKTDANGDYLWSKVYGAIKPDTGRCVRQTIDGGYIITGITQSYGAGSNDLWLIKTDANGNEMWDKTFGGTSWDRGVHIEFTEEGGYMILGDTDSFGIGPADLLLIKIEFVAKIITPTGINIEINDPFTNVSLIFNEVSNSGNTTIFKKNLGPNPNSGFNVLDTYYDISTTASYIGSITIAIPYDESQISGNETDLRLMHWDSALGIWVDITTWIDTVNNIIYGETSSFSIFVVMEQIDFTPPTTELIITDFYVDAENNIYVNYNSTFILIAFDDLSGIQKTFYRINGGDWIEYIDIFNLTGPLGNYLIEYYSVDAVGNHETIKSINIILEEECEGYGILRIDSEWYIGGASLFISEDLIRMDIENQTVTWDITSEYMIGNLEIVHGEGELGKITVIIYKGCVFAIGKGVFFLGST